MNTNNFSLFFETSAKTGENVEKVYISKINILGICRSCKISDNENVY